MKNKKGFTLIELLVVVSIISLLASIVLSSLNSAKSAARNAKRYGDLEQLYRAFNSSIFNGTAMPVIAPYAWISRV